MDGLLLIDKPSGPTSHDVVARVRRLLKIRSVGHAGTLDPIASGLLVMLIGEATKLSDLILKRNKRYWARIRLGVETDTLDREGQVVKTSPVFVSEQQIGEALKGLEGELDLPIPIFSATKVDGRKLYEYARSDQAVVLPHKLMRFSNVRWAGRKGEDADCVEVELTCAKGGFVRSFASELGRRLGCGGMVQELRRTESEPYRVEDALTLEELERRLSEGVSLSGAWIPFSEALPDWKSCYVKGREERLLRNGQVAFELANRLVWDQKQAIARQATIGVKVMNPQGDIVGLLELEPAKGLKIRRVFPQHAT